MNSPQSQTDLDLSLCRAMSAAGGVACPYCRSTFKSEKGVKTHIRRSNCGPPASNSTNAAAAMASNHYGQGRSKLTPSL